MRKALFIALLAMSPAAFGQYYYLTGSGDTPGGLNQDDAFPAGGGQPAGWTSILGPSVGTPAWSADQTIPFAFNFNGAPVTDFKVSSTGVLTFDVSAGAVPGSTPAALPNASVPNNSVAAWGLEASGANDNVSVKTYGTAPNRQHWIHFSSCTNGTIGWSYWSIVLEESTDKIYVVDQRNTSGTGALSIGIQIDGSTAYSVAGSPSVGATAGADPSSADDFYYEFIQGVQPANEVELVSFDILPYIIAGNVDLQGTVKNNGSAPITTLSVTWNDGSGPNQANIPGLNIAPNATYQFTHPTALTAVAGSTYNLDLCATVTGDANTANDCLSATANAASGSGTKLPLAEVLTSSTCPPCYSLNVVSGYDGNGLDAGLASLNANDPSTAQIAAIKWQVNWPGNGDHAYNPDVATRVNYYSVNSAPTQVMDGSAGTAITPTSVTTAAGTIALVDIDAEFTISGDDIDVTATVTPYVDIANARVMIALLEEEYDATNDGSFSNGETTFHNVFRKALPDANGTTTNLTDGTDFVVNESYTRTVNTGLPAQGSYDFHAGTNLQVVVFVEDPATQQVLNAAIATNQSVGIDEQELGFGIAQFPNPTSGMSKIVLDLNEQSTVNIEVVDLAGKTVFQDEANVSSGTNMFNVDLTHVNSGVYFANVKVNDKTTTVKINVTK